MFPAQAFGQLRGRHGANQDPYAAADLANFTIDQAQKQTSLAAGQLDKFYSGLGPMATGGPVSYTDFASYAGDMLKMGMINPTEYQTLVRGAPTDPQRLKSYVQGLYTRGISPETLMQPQEMGVVPAGQPNAGAPIRGTAMQGLQKATGTAPVAPVQSGGALPSAAPANAVGQTQADQQPQQVADSGGYISGLAPGQSEAMTASNVFSAKQGNDLQAQADLVPSRKTMLNEMLASSEKFTGGPMSERIAYLKKMGNELGITNIDLEGVAAQEQFAKLAKQIALAQTQALGASTDEKLLTSLGANPNTSLSNLGNRQIIHLLLGNEDAITAKNMAWQPYKAQNGEGSYGQFSTEFNKNFDPRAFQAAYMDPKERADLVSNLKTPAAKAKFAKTLRLGISLGLIQMPGAQQ